METERPDVVLLTVDALRADHLGCYGYHRDTSPFLDDLVGEFTRFESAYSASSNTREAVSALLTGRYPDRAVDAGYELAAPTIAADLGDHGYATAAFHSNPYVSRAYGYGSDFDRFDDDLHLGRHKLVALAQRALDKLRNRHYARAKEINARALDWLDSLDHGRPAFLWNHYMDVHGPYEPPGEYRTLFRDEPVGDRAAQRLYRAAVSDPDDVGDFDRRTLVDLYDAEIRYLDDRLREFLAALDARDRLDEALVVVTADHGDAFGEHGYFEHPPRLHEELVRVPLLAKGISGDSPGRDADDVVDVPTSTLDVAATVRRTAGLEPAGPGRLLDAVAAGGDERRTVLSQARGIGDDAGIRRFAARNGEHCARAEYDTGSGSLDVVAGRDTPLADRLRDHIAERVGEGPTGTDAGGTEPSVEVRRRLEALGYGEE